MNTQRPSVIFSTRIWKFKTDEIRLSAFSNARFLEFMKERFSFENAELSTPQYPGAEYRAISPPGIALEYGMAPINFDEQGEPTEHIAVRAMGMDANNIAVEVAGSTRYTDDVYNYLRFLIEDAKTPDGDPYLGNHWSVQDFSMISVPGVYRTAERMAGGPFYSALKVHFGDPKDEQITSELLFTIEGLDGSPIWTLRPRFGTSSHDGVLESQAWLSSEKHLALLQDIEGLFGPGILAIEDENDS